MEEDLNKGNSNIVKTNSEEFKELQTKQDVKQECILTVTGKDQEQYEYIEKKQRKGLT